MKIRSECGLTLVEMIVAAGLTITITAALLSSDLISRQSMRLARIDMEAANVLASYIEQQKNTPYVNLADQNFPGITLSDSGTADAADDLLGDIAIDVTDNGDDTTTILATATWNYRHINATLNRTIQLQTMVAEP